MWSVFYIICGMLGFSFLVIGHELGHFIFAKFNGVKVEVFSIGMGPKLFSISGTETEYMIKVFPIGGYVKMLGEEEETNHPKAFSSKSPIRRLSIGIAGPAMNITIAALLFLIYGFSQGIVIPQINDFVKGKPAQNTTLQKGDKIVKVNGKHIDIYEELITEIDMSKGNPISLIVERKGKIQQTISVKPQLSNEKNIYELGITFTKIENPGLFISIKYALIETKGIIDVTFNTYKGLFQGKLSLNSVGGPITIIKMSGKYAKAGIFPLIYFLAFISMNLAIFNLLPFPSLDGGLSLLSLYEIITGRKINNRKIAIANNIGFMLLMTLMVVVTIKDIIFPFVI